MILESPLWCGLTGQLYELVIVWPDWSDQCQPARMKGAGQVCKDDCGGTDCMNLRREGAPAFLPTRTPVPRGAADELQKLIRAQQLQPGDQLPAQRELAERLGVSRASLREALSALETLGFVS